MDHQLGNERRDRRLLASDWACPRRLSYVLRRKGPSICWAGSSWVNQDGASWGQTVPREKAPMGSRGCSTQKTLCLATLESLCSSKRKIAAYTSNFLVPSFCIHANSFFKNHLKVTFILRKQKCWQRQQQQLQDRSSSVCERPHFWRIGTPPGANITCPLSTHLTRGTCRSHLKQWWAPSPAFRPPCLAPLKEPAWIGRKPHAKWTMLKKKFWDKSVT